jgi:hypothetical protein
LGEFEVPTLTPQQVTDRGSVPVREVEPFLSLNFVLTQAENNRMIRTKADRRCIRFFLKEKLFSPMQQPPLYSRVEIAGFRVILDKNREITQSFAPGWCVAFLYFVPQVIL